MSRIGILVSGRGSNLQALIDAQIRDELKGEIVVVISNKSNAYGLERADKAGITTRCITKKEFPDRTEYDREVITVLKENDVDLIVLAGYMRILTEDFVSEYENRIINIHPSLLPSFRGVNAQEQAVEYGVTISGCTTHFVTHEMDAGPVILQQAVNVLESDTRETLASRILIEEHKLLVRSVRLFCEGKLTVKGRKVHVKK
ncbi:MAG: phosphoribosylglycinamide formyltransferase [Candidatus Thorarchaeota archaeon]